LIYVKFRAQSGVAGCRIKPPFTPGSRASRFSFDIYPPLPLFFAKEEIAMTTAPARIIHRTIARDWRAVYAFAARPENMPLWASGLAAGLTQDGDEWVAAGGPIGDVRVRFAPPNDFGVIDHRVTLPNGVVVDNALRVVPNGDGAEVMFTLLRQPGMDDAAFEADAAHIARDLETLTRLMEDKETPR
jgi:hypothetical protein